MRSKEQSGELVVIAKTKDLCSYVFTVTDKSPKRFRFTMVSKLQMYALETLENLFRANEVYIGNRQKEKAEERLNYQHKALTSLKLLGYMAQLALEQWSDIGSITFLRSCVWAKEPGSFSAKTFVGKTHAVGDFGRESFQSIGSGGCPIPPAADWKNKTEEDYDR